MIRKSASTAAGGSRKAGDGRRGGCSGWSAQFCTEWRAGRDSNLLSVSNANACLLSSPRSREADSPFTAPNPSFPHAGPTTACGGALQSYAGLGFHISMTCDPRPANSSFDQRAPNLRPIGITRGQHAVFRTGRGAGDFAVAGGREASLAFEEMAEIGRVAKAEAVGDFLDIAG